MRAAFGPSIGECGETAVYKAARAVTVLEDFRFTSPVPDEATVAVEKIIQHWCKT